MFNAPVPPPDSLPSSGALLRSTLIAVAVAGVLLVTIVLPAEYGIDPTGLGRLTGLQRMGEIKVALALQAEADAQAEREAQAAEEAAAARFAAQAARAEAEGPTEELGEEALVVGGSLEMLELSLEPGGTAEIELVMDEGAKVRYEWWTVGGVVDFETHGRPSEAQGGSLQGYGEGQARDADEGLLTAAFDGLHGWTWKNPGADEVIVTLRVEGDFVEVRESR